MIDQWLIEVKKECKNDELGMILVHNGIVRATSKEGKQVRGMNLSYDREKLFSLIRQYQQREGIAAIRIWINEGNLNIGDDIMCVLVAGRFRTDVLPVFKQIIGIIKKEIISEKEFV